MDAFTDGFVAAFTLVFLISMPVAIAVGFWMGIVKASEETDD